LAETFQKVNKVVCVCVLDDRSKAGSLFQSRGPATSNDLLPRGVLDHGMTHDIVMSQDQRRRRLASGHGILYNSIGARTPCSGADLHASERYDGAQSFCPSTWLI